MWKTVGLSDKKERNGLVYDAAEMSAGWEELGCWLSRVSGWEEGTGLRVRIG